MVVALRETAHHDELVVDERDTRHTANDLGGIFVLRALYLLAADARLHAQGVLGGPEDTHLGVLTAFGDDGDFLQHLGIGSEQDFEGVLLLFWGEAGGLVTHIGDDEGVGRLDGEREESVEVGGGAGGSAGDEDGSTDERFAGVGVENKTGERLRCERMGNKKEKG